MLKIWRIQDSLHLNIVNVVKKILLNLNSFNLIALYSTLKPEARGGSVGREEAREARVGVWEDGWYPADQYVRQVRTGPCK